MRLVEETVAREEAWPHCCSADKNKGCRMCHSPGCGWAASELELLRGSLTASSTCDSIILQQMRGPFEPLQPGQICHNLGRGRMISELELLWGL